MVVREDLVVSAVAFLQDPSVVNSPVDKKIAFLQSKNLTQEEIDVSLARAAEQPAQSNYGYQPQTQLQPMPPRQGYGYQPAGYWQPPPELPKRDWRDYFIMATVMSGLGYGLYAITKRYIVPLIAPPTPPQLEADKASIDASFDRAFALLDQLSTDTTELKASEEARKTRLDAALAEVETVIADLKTASRRRDEEGRRISDEVAAVKALVPEAMRAQKEAMESRLVELGGELKSLKTLVGNRLGGGGAQASGAAPRPTAAAAAAVANPSAVNGTASPSLHSGLNGESDATTAALAHHTGDEGKTEWSAAPAPDRAQNASPFARTAARSGIPAWQMAAAAKKESAEKKAAAAASSSESGTAVDAEGVAA